MSENAIEPVPAPRTAKRARLQGVTIEDGVLKLAGSDDEHALVELALGGGSVDFQGYCLTHLINVLAAAGSDDYTIPINAALTMLSAIGPKDELEAMLAVQMVASNHLAMMTMRRAAHSTSPEIRQINGNLATKFSRTFTAQLEALGKHRRGGKQIVEHVHVNAGGQAVFAEVVDAGGTK